MQRPDVATTPATSHSGVSHKHLAVISKGIESGRPPGRVFYWENDGFMVLDDRAPEEAADIDRKDLTVVCLDCLIDRHPAIARGMDIACHGGGLARYSEGAWRGERLVS
jgi:hypothetical protein